MMTRNCSGRHPNLQNHIWEEEAELQHSMSAIDPHALSKSVGHRIPIFFVTF